jgi:hypothetical protein
MGKYLKRMDELIEYTERNGYTYERIRFGNLFFFDEQMYGFRYIIWHRYEAILKRYCRLKGGVLFADEVMEFRNLYIKHYDMGRPPIDYSGYGCYIVRSRYRKDDYELEPLIGLLVQCGWNKIKNVERSLKKICGAEI